MNNIKIEKILLEKDDELNLYSNDTEEPALILYLERENNEYKLIWIKNATDRNTVFYKIGEINRDENTVRLVGIPISPHGSVCIDKDPYKIDCEYAQSLRDRVSDNYAIMTLCFDDNYKNIIYYYYDNQSILYDIDKGEILEI